MEKNYREINFSAGCRIESAINELKRHNDLVCGSFNGHMLYSDIDDIDSAFKKVTGKTKAEFDEYVRKKDEAYMEEKRKHEELIPKLTEKWIGEGAAILDKKYHELWNKIVPIRLDDLYRGMELGSCLDIIKELNNGCELSVAKEIIEKQGHSGMSFGLVCSMVNSLCDRGSEFVSYARANQS